MSKETSKWLNTMTLIGFALKRGVAWHYRKEDQGAKSNHYDGAIPVEDVQARLFNFEVASAPVQYTNPVTGAVTEYVQNGKPQAAYFRTDTGAGLGIHSNNWQGHGYTEWLLSNVANLLDDDLRIGSAGLLRDGAQAFVSIEPEDNIDVHGDAFRPALVACTSYDGTLASTYAMTMVRVVCDNTLAAGLGSASARFKVKHTKNSGLQIANAREALGIMFDSVDAFSAEVDRLMNTTVSDEQWAKFLDVHVPMPEAQTTKGGGPGRGYTMAESKRDALTGLYRTDERVKAYTGTAYGVLQADNTWRLHNSQVKSGGAVTRAQRNMSNLLTGIQGDADGLALANLALVLA